MFSVTFIKRPILAIVISLVIITGGLVSMLVLPISEYPDVAPPTVNVSATYTGANAFVVEDTVTRVLEDKLNGIKGVIYMDSSSTSSGASSINVYFEPGYDIDIGAVDVQNKVSTATASLPAAPDVGDMVFIGDYNAACSVSTPIVVTSIDNIHGSDENLIVTASNVSLVFQYVDPTVGWKIIDGIGEESSPPGYVSQLMWSGTISADNASVSWLSSGYKLSDFDEVIFTLEAEVYLLGRGMCEIRMRPEQLLNALYPVLLFQHVEPGTGTKHTILSLAAITETDATLQQQQSVFVSTLKEIRGISYSK